MEFNLDIGASHTIELTVRQEHTARTFGSGAVDVYATPCMILHMEAACATAVQDGLPEGWSSVGTVVNIEHTAATPVGMSIRVTAKLTRIDGRRLVFNVEAFDDRGQIGRGVHERFVVDIERFMERANRK